MILIKIIVFIVLALLVSLCVFALYVINDRMKYTRKRCKEFKDEIIFLKGFLGNKHTITYDKKYCYYTHNDKIYTIFKINEYYDITQYNDEYNGLKSYGGLNIYGLDFIDGNEERKLQPLADEYEKILDEITLYVDDFIDNYVVYERKRKLKILC
jgi:hypothetical protein